MSFVIILFLYKNSESKFLRMINIHEILNYLTSIIQKLTSTIKCSKYYIILIIVNIDQINNFDIESNLLWINLNSYNLAIHQENM